MPAASQEKRMGKEVQAPAEEVQEPKKEAQEQAEVIQASAQQITGRALVDLPMHGFKCGEFGTLPQDIAQALENHGEFDTQAVEQD